MSHGTFTPEEIKKLSEEPDYSTYTLAELLKIHYKTMAVSAAIAAAALKKKGKSASKKSPSKGGRRKATRRRR
jgi:hypothetical protein